MHPLPPLADLGRRIMILGPTNAGKSTLAHAIGRKLDIPTVHIDQFSHLPGTDWTPRDTATFHALHDEAILEQEWVMDGNYTAIMPQRFARATGVIVVDDHFPIRYVRYFRRTLFQPHRIGGLAGGKDSVKWEMIAWIWKTRNATKYRLMAAQSGLPTVLCRNSPELQALYMEWDLERHR